MADQWRLMTSQAFESPAGLSADTLPPLDVRTFNWQRWLTAGISLALLIAILLRLHEFGVKDALSVLPASPAFWLAFAAYYLVLPGSEWAIFRKLWKLPKGGFLALLRKLVSNEILIGYSGEAYFYAWARRHANLIAAPFGTIKDVSILSALAGNIVTLGMLAIAWPFIGTVIPKIHDPVILLSTAIILGSSLMILLLRGSFFSLDRKSLYFVFRIHLLRIAVATLLSGLMWHIALPGTPSVWLLVLATLQLLVSRLPFLPSKDLVFANLAALLIGHNNHVAMVIAMITAAILATHLMVGAVLVLTDILERHEP